MKGRFISDGYTGQTLPRFCPACFQMLDGVTNLTSKDAPQPFDFTVCIYCASVLKFSAKMDLELSALIDVPVVLRFEFAKVVTAIKARIGGFSGQS